MMRVIPGKVWTFWDLEGSERYFESWKTPKTHLSTLFSLVPLLFSPPTAYRHSADHFLRFVRTDDISALHSGSKWYAYQIKYILIVKLLKFIQKCFIRFLCNLYLIDSAVKTSSRQTLTSSRRDLHLGSSNTRGSVSTQSNNSLGDIVPGTTYWITFRFGYRQF